MSGTVNREGTARARVVHVITMLEWGGAQENTLYSVEHLDPGRYDRVLVAGKGGMLDGRARRISGLRVILLEDLIREVRPVRDAKAFLALRSILREEKREAGGDPLVVHTHSSKAGILGRAAARMAGADAVVHSIHGFGFHDGQSKTTHALYVNLEKMASRWTDAFVAVSEENIRAGVQEGIFRRDRCRLIRSGFDTRRFLVGSREAGRKILGIPEGVPVVGTVAVFKPQKAPLDFVETARRVASEIPESRFVMVGDGELREEAERAVAAIGMSDRFLFLGWRPEVPELMAAFDVFLLTSRWEGLPKVVPQALIAGCRVVATAVDGTREIVDHGVDGVLAPPGDVDALARGVADILEGRLPMDAARKRDLLVREFDQAEMVGAQERLYAEILAGKGFPGWS